MKCLKKSSLSFFSNQISSKKNWQGFVLYCLFIFAISAPLRAESPLEEGKRFYEEAARILNESSTPEERSKATPILEKAREAMLKVSDLSDEDQALLGKISSTLYWQYKFRPMEDEAVLVPEPEAAKTDSNKTEPVDLVGAWAKLKAQKKAQFDGGLTKAQEYEQKHGKDFYNNMLNYLMLQDFIVEKDDAVVAMDKSREYQELHKSEQEEALKSAMEGTEWESLLYARKYGALVQKIVAVSKARGSTLSPIAKQALKNAWLENSAMDAILDILKSSPLDAVRFYSPNSGLSGMIDKIDDKGITVFLKKELKNTTMSWELVEESVILDLAKQMMGKKETVDSYLLGMLNLRMNQYQEAFYHFQDLIRSDAKNMLKYRSYLERCEQGFRVESGEKIEKELARALGLAKSGFKEQAMQVLNELRDEYLLSPLGKSYLNRYYMATAEICRY